MTLAPVSAADLAPLATVLRSDRGKRAAYPVVTEPGDSRGRPVFSVAEALPSAGPTVILTKLERHPHTSQTFVPLTVSRWLVVVAPKLADGNPDIGQLRAFIAGPGDAVCFHRDVWHAPLVVLDQPAEMAMLMWRADAGDDVVMFDLAAPVTLDL